MVLVFNTLSTSLLYALCSSMRYKPSDKYSNLWLQHPKQDFIQKCPCFLLRYSVFPPTTCWSMPFSSFLISPLLCHFTGREGAAGDAGPLHRSEVAASETRYHYYTPCYNW